MNDLIRKGIRVFAIYKNAHVMGMVLVPVLLLWLILPHTLATFLICVGIAIFANLVGRAVWKTKTIIGFLKACRGK